MSRITWELIPPEFVAAAKDDNHIWWLYSEIPQIDKINGRWESNPTSYCRRMVDSEFRKDAGGVDWEESLETREEFESEVWEEAPDWARYHATDENGSAWWFETHPRCNETSCEFQMDDVLGGGFDPAPRISHWTPWKESMRERPGVSAQQAPKEGEETLTFAVRQELALAAILDVLKTHDLIPKGDA